MNKGKIARLAGFVGVLGATTVLITTAVTGTGAYFTDSHSGSIAASSGHLTLNVSNPNLSFPNLLPGEDKTVNIGYNVDSSGNSDIWMTFTDTAAYCAFTGASDDPANCGGGLGRYGHFAVANDNGILFQSLSMAIVMSPVVAR